MSRRQGAHRPAKQERSLHSDAPRTPVRRRRWPDPTPAVDRVAAADDRCNTESPPATDAAGNGFPIATGWLTFGVGAGSVFDVG